MKLEALEVYRYALPLAEPLRLGGRTLATRHGLLLKLQGEGGATGWGEAAPLPGFSPESLEEAAAQALGLRAAAAGCAVTEGWLDPDGTLGGGLDGLTRAPSLRFGLELAGWNLLAAVRGLPLPAVLAPEPRPVVTFNGLLAGPPEAVLAAARRMRAEGYRAVKLKVGRAPASEEGRLVRAVRAALGPAVALRLDANRAWTPAEAAAFVRAAGDAAFEYLEEPLADPAGLPDFVRDVQVPVALDETLLDLPPERLEDHAYARAVVLKPTLLGGRRTLALARRALALGLVPVLSAAYESGVGTLGLVALAAAVGTADVPAGLDTYRRLGADVLAPPLALRGGRIDVEGMMRTARTLDVQRLQPL